MGSITRDAWWKPARSRPHSASVDELRLHGLSGRSAWLPGNDRLLQLRLESRQRLPGHGTDSTFAERQNATRDFTLASGVVPRFSGPDLAVLGDALVYAFVDYDVSLSQYTAVLRADSNADCNAYPIAPSQFPPTDEFRTENASYPGCILPKSVPFRINGVDGIALEPVSSQPGGPLDTGLLVTLSGGSASMSRVTTMANAEGVSTWLQRSAPSPIPGVVVSSALAKREVALQRVADGGSAMPSGGLLLAYVDTQGVLRQSVMSSSWDAAAILPRRRRASTPPVWRSPQRAPLRWRSSITTTMVSKRC